MGRFVKITGALLFTATIFGIALMMYWAKFDNQSEIGMAVKARMIKYPVLVQLINLDEPGDSRFAYLRGGEEDRVQVYVHFADGMTPDSQVQSWIEETLISTTGKRPDVTVASSADVPNKASYTDADLNSIRESFVKNSLGSSQLHIVYLTEYGEQPDFVGVTIHRDTIFLFKSTMNQLTRDPDILERLERSTMMHEWGHLLGLEHDTQPNCVMSEEAEVFDSRFLSSQSIPVEYCQNTFEQIEKMR